MPHSDPQDAEAGSTPPSATQMEEEPAVAVAAPTSPLAEEDYVMVEAGEVQGVEEDAKPAAESALAQIDQDEDMGVEIKQEKKTELKLEDLFDGMDSDDDFPSSNNPLNIQAAA